MKNEIKKVDPKEYGLQEKEAKTIDQAFMPKIVERDGLKKIYEQILSKEITLELCSEAKSIRLKLVKVRTGIAEIHKTQKAFFLAAGRYVDAWKNKETLPVTQMEENLTAIEEHYQRIEGEKIAKKVIKSLDRAALWKEVKDRLHDSALGLSGGQQQRLCIARCLAVEPEVILFDEPCASLDPISTRSIEELILELKKYYTIVIVTHNMQQAARISDFTAFLYLGELIEFGPTEKLFTVPKEKTTEEYLTGKFG